MQSIFKAILLMTSIFVASSIQADSMGSKRIVVDAPDLFKVPESAVKPSFNDLIGTSVYSNKDKEIGKIEDFVIDKKGNVYAVVDTDDGPIAELVAATMDELVVIPVRELRVR